MNALNSIRHDAATDEELESYAYGVFSGIATSATPNVVGSILARVRSSQAEIARLREALAETLATIESMRSENRLHGHITDASSRYLRIVEPLARAALEKN